MGLINRLKSKILKRLLHSEMRRWSRHILDHFIPHERNNYQPHALKHRVLFGYSIFLILVKILVIVLPVALPSSSLFSSSITSQNIVDLTNQTRKNLILKELTVNSKLVKAAEAKANDMLKNQYFSHTSPTGVTPWDWLAKSQYDYLYAGENLAVHYVSSEDVQEGWLASPSHRANIVNARYNEIGVGVATGEFEGVSSTVVVQMFGQPVKTAVAVTTPKVTVPPQVVAVAKPEPSVATGKVAAAEKDKVAAKPAPSFVTLPVSVNNPIVPIKPSAEVVNVLPPVIYEDSLKIKAEGEAYVVRLVVTGASGVTAQLGSESATMTRNGVSDVWQTLIQYDKSQLNPGGEQLMLVAWAKDGSITNKPLAWIAPQVKTQQLYTFNEGSDKYAKFFGGLLTVHNLNDSVRQFYLYFMVFLGAALLLNIFIKIRVQYPSVINHTLLVIALALFLVIV
jgi:hypothetical protein